MKDGTLEDFDIDKALGGVQTTADAPEVEETQPQEEVKAEAPKEGLKEEPKAEAPKEEPRQEAKEDSKQEVKKDPAPELDDARILQYLKEKKGREVNSLDDLFATKEPEVKEVNPWEDVLDDTDREYLNYKKETGNTYQDFLALKKDWNQVDAKELARDRARKETGLSLTNEEADEYIADLLSIDVEDPEGLEKIKFQSYANAFRKEKIEEQKKYALPKTEKKEQSPSAPADNSADYVQLDNGQSMLKAEYDKLVNQRNEYLNGLKSSVDGITETEFKFAVDDNGEKRDLEFKYEFTDEDRHSMLSKASDVTKYIQSRYVDEKGNVKASELAQALWRGEKENQEKMFKALANKVYAQAIEDYLSVKNNVNFKPGNLEKNTAKKEGYGDVLGARPSGFGVIGNL